MTTEVADKPVTPEEAFASFLRKNPFTTEPQPQQAPAAAAAGESTSKDANGTPSAPGGNTVANDSGNAAAAKPDAAAAAATTTPPAANASATNETPTTEKKDAPKPEADAKDAAASATEEESAPKSRADWERYKGKRAQVETSLKQQITALETKLKDAESKAAEVEQLKSKSGELPPEVQAKLDALQKENETYSQRLAAVEVTQHPKFQAYFNNKIDTQIKRARAAVGADVADQVESLLRQPDSPLRNQQIEDIMAGLTGLKAQQLGGAIDKLADIEQERQDEIAKSLQSREKLNTESAEKQKAQMKEYEKLFTDTLTQLRDPNDGMVVFKETADPEWNKATAEAVENAKSLLLGKMTPQDGIKAALMASIMPKLLKTYASDMAAAQKDAADKDAKIAELEQRVASLSAVQPKPTTTVTTDTQTGAVQAREYKIGMTPQEALNRFANW